MPHVSHPRDADAAYDEFAPIARRRAATSARPLDRAIPERESATWYDADQQSWDAGEWETRETWDESAGWGGNDAPEDADEYAEDADDDADAPRALTPYHSGPPLAARLASAPHTDLARPRRVTQQLLHTARSPWSLTRSVLAVVATLVALIIGFAQAGEPSQPLMAFQAQAESRVAINVAQAVKPLTSLKRPDQYDSPQQFATYSPAACAPSSMAEVLTAWGVRHATIGQMIDDLGSYLSPYAGLLDQAGFQVAAAKEGFRADISWHMTYNQLLYLTNVRGIPVIFEVKRDFGYYHYFAGGHFLTLTGGDARGVTIVDSSEYYITYLPRDVFLSLWQWRGDGTAQTIVLVPQDYEYTLPPP